MLRLSIRDTTTKQPPLRHKNPTTTNRYLQNLGIEAVRKGLEEGLKGQGKVIKLTQKEKVTDKG